MFQLSDAKRLLRGCCAMAVLVMPMDRMWSQELPALMPLPAHLEQHAGQMPLDNSFDVTLTGYTEPRLERARLRFLGRMVQQTGTPLVLSAPGNHRGLVVHTAAASKPVQTLGEDESYRLEITPEQATLTAPTPLGALHGMQTFLQLVEATPQGFAVPAVLIEDKPRFAWRGVMLDTGRHFQPLAQVWQTLDAMEAVKLNVFHWHLSEDQGFRIESKRFPLLAQKGSDGLFYTQDEVRDTLQYARDRGIRVIPEFDMPGHTTAWFVGYPQLASAPGPYQIERKWGVFDPAMDPSREETYTFLDAFLGEMTALFPDAYFHVGGDECNGKQWDGNPRIQQFMRAHSLKDNAALQAYFTARVQKLVARHGKVMVGWDEVLQPDTPHDVVIQSWRGPESLADAARRGYRGLLSSGYYLDLNQPAGEHYLADPLDAAKKGTALTPEQEGNILGGEAAMWTEFITPEILGNRLWPRAAVVAERLWSPRDVRDVPSMYARLAVIADELNYLGVRDGGVRADMVKRLSGDPAPEALLTLASVVQPPRDYTRESLTPYNQFTPLNHLADAIPSESETARQFTDLAERIHTGKATPEERAEVRSWLEQWQGNDARFQPKTGASNLTEELVPASRSVSRAAAIGLEALDRIERHTQGNAKTMDEQMTELKAMEPPDKAALRNMLLPGVLLLFNTH